MTDAISIVTISTATLIAIAMLAVAGLKGWQGWLDLERQRLGPDRDAMPSPAGARIELADLRERVRKLEAIAAGIDL